MRSMYLAILMSLALFPSATNAMQAAAYAAETEGTPIQYNFGQQYQIRSDILSEDRQLLIYVPDGYQTSEEKFPVIYVLEGDTHFKHAVISAEKIQKSGWMPASLIVAITDSDGTSTRDYRHEGDTFLRFIKEEVQPFMAKNFRVNGYDTLFGHGISGTFAVETFIKEPAAFDSYIIGNPYLREPALQRFEAMLDQKQPFDQALYFSVGTVLDNGSYNVEPVEQLAALLKKKAPEGLQWHYQYIPLHGARSSANVTFYDGLSANHKDFQGPFITSYQEFIDGGGMEGVKAYYRERAKKFHIASEIELNEVDIGTYQWLGFMFMDGGHPKEAVELVSGAIANQFPQSVQLHRVLGRAHLITNSYTPALEAYEKMAALAKEQNHPQLDRFENLVTQLKQRMAAQ